MDKLRKFFERLWYSKERAVLAIMVGVLCWNVYRVWYPVPLPEAAAHTAPQRVSEDEPTVNVPGLEPRQTQDWVTVYTPDPFWYYSQLTANTEKTKDVQDAGIKLILIRKVRDEYRAQLQTESSTKWYTEGDAFESFELLKIDPDAGTCQVRSERLGRVITLRQP